MNYSPTLGTNHGSAFAHEFLSIISRLGASLGCYKVGFGCGAAHLSSLQDFHCGALYFTWDMHPRLAHAVPIGSKIKTIAPQFKEQKSHKTLGINCLVNINILTAQASVKTENLNWRCPIKLGDINMRVELVRNLGVVVACLLAVNSINSQATAQVGGTLRERIVERIAEQRNAAQSASQELSYGSDSLQKLDYWKPTTSDVPLVVFVHGGGWKRGDKREATGLKGTHFVQQGYAFASINYRLVPEHKVEDQSQDVADAIAYLIKNAEQLGFDSKRVAVMGHSAGAHLSALVGTDMQYLEKAGLDAQTLRGVIPLDGAAYDAGRQIQASGELMHDTYLQAFGSELKRQEALSPTLQAAAPNAAAFLILHVQRIDGTAQSNALAAALQKSGTPVEVKGFSGRGLAGHAEINRSLGDPDYPATPVVDDWLKKIFAK